MNDTITALATPPGIGAIAVVRVSGPAVADVCKTILPKFKMKPRLANLTTVIANKGANYHINPGEELIVVDTLIAIYFPAPNSYTGEDVLELFPHGNPFIVRKLLEAICNVPGVRLAERGEFTQRAFLNGKIDLTQAEAVGDILRASDSKSLSNAHRLLSGEVYGEIKTLTESIKEVSALLELEVDFSEDIEGSMKHEIVLKANSVLHILQNLKKRFKVLQNDLPRVALFGAPNAGKSSLINALIKGDRLLVSQVPGTTRDFVEVPLHLPSGDILLIDTAGFANKAQNEIDELAMQKSKEVLEKANLKILVVNISIPLPIEFKTWINMSDLIVWTHIDLIENGELKVENGICVASPKNEGIRELIESLENIFFEKTEKREDIWLTSERQITCIKKAEECVLRVLDLLTQNALELAAFEMREAKNALCSVTGEISDESILNTIFSSYCIGK